MANINLHNVSKEEEALELAKADLVAFGKLFLPDDLEDVKVHSVIMKLQMLLWTINIGN